MQHALTHMLIIAAVAYFACAAMWVLAVNRMAR